MTGADPAGRTATLEARLSRVADGLLRIDAEPECRLLRERDALVGVSAALADEVAPAFERVWRDYRVAREHADSGRILDVAAMVEALDTDVHDILEAADRIAAAWRTALPKLDEIRERLTAAETDAKHLAMADDRELIAARRMVDHLAAQTARDPLSVDAAPAEAATDRVASRLAELVSRRDRLPADLAAAGTTLERIRTLVAEGRDALVATRDRIVDPQGLLEPLDVALLDTAPRGLAPWLARLQEEAAAGRWQPACAGLDEWNATASQWIENAERVVRANRAPVERRNELRGLLDAYRAKTAATGRAEDRTLTDALQRARAVLHTAPCDLGEADRLVQEYARLVSER